MKKLFSGLLIIWGIVIVILGLFFGSKIPFEIHLKIYDEFKDISVGILTIAGIWLGVLYPAEFTKIFQKGAEVQGNVSDNILSLVRILSISAFNLLFFMVIVVVAYTLKSISLNPAFIDILKVGSFILICLLGSMQIWTLVILLNHTLWFDILMSLKKMRQNKTDQLLNVKSHG